MTRDTTNPGGSAAQRAFDGKIDELTELAEQSEAT